ncbi:phosphoribosylformylglycinamidine synthase subunit PurQ [Fluviicola taffensis]|uniref:Phosphoribosylformylglycinamidine synthase subunit PurQ n=1 Tax=Fluviicola taffensis (strain DSM 16823 / NCIMB 13979 / RW262) TaxID=755732 RepID=F2IIB7_FLUTR|nr:phosphoribosylformylglycinamidine synthase subunit PurQ [Fluviicola taffensis]AEA43826.1 phosphoribosylformylglycinamidine synthase subunit I [Fluviicola taffensis DSM 16823]
MKFGVVTFPGSNCDEDMVYVLETIMGQQVERLWHKDTSLKGVDFVVLPGGFSYGDYLRSGAIAKLSPIMGEVMNHADKGGYVMGICNGFQILTESGLLQGALLHNNNQKFICKNVYLKPATSNSAITKGLDAAKAYKIPIAHGEGRFFAPEDTMKSILDNDQVLFHYVNEEAQVSDLSNPNGSMHDIAGICNPGRNVFGMMPHPERAADAALANEDGKRFFESILKYC